MLKTPTRRGVLRATLPALLVPRLAAPFLMRAETPKVVTLADLQAATAKVEDLVTQFTAKSDELTKGAEKAMKEVADKGALATETKGQIDKFLVEQTAMQGELNKARERMAAMEQELARRPGGGGGPTAYKSAGRTVAEDEKFKAFASGKVRGKIRVDVKAAITSVDIPINATPGDGIMQPQIVPGTVVLPKQRLFVRDLIPVGQTGSPAIFWIQQTGFVNNARVVTEGAKKPESNIIYTSKMTAVATIAHTFKASKQIMDDFAQLRTDIDREMRYGLKYAEEQEILLGDGEGNHLAGIVPAAQHYVPAFEVAHHNRIDDIRLGILQSQLARLPATGIVTHFIDWAQMELTKDENGQYVFANPLRLAGTTLWGLPVVPTEIPEFEGNFLAGAFQAGAQIYDREEMGVEIATENADDFEKNMITGRCEERIALAIPRPEAFTFGPYTVTTE